MATAFSYEPTFQLDRARDETPHKKLTGDFVSTVDADGRTLLRVQPAALKLLARQAFVDISFFLRTSHLAKLAEELKDPEASDNDRFVIYTHLQNAVVASAGKLPGCQDTGTAVVIGKKGQYVLTDCDDAEAFSKGIYETFNERNLRYSQIAPLSMFEET